MKKNIFILVFVIIVSLIIVVMDKSKPKDIIVNIDNKKMNMEEYMCRVIIGEMEDYDNIEAMKAFSVIVRSNFIRSFINKEKFVIKEEKVKNISTSQKNVYNKAKEAIRVTKGEVLTYKGNIISVPYHEISTGKTFNTVDNKKIPYLKSVDCDEDIESSNYLQINYYKLEALDTIQKKLQENLIGANSCFIEKNKNRIRVVTQGIGHGYGMSLHSANTMGMKGCCYEEILKRFYNNIKIVKVY